MISTTARKSKHAVNYKCYIKFNVNVKFPPVLSLHFFYNLSHYFPDKKQETVSVMKRIIFHSLFYSCLRFNS